MIVLQLMNSILLKSTLEKILNRYEFHNDSVNEILDGLFELPEFNVDPENFSQILETICHRVSSKRLRNKFGDNIIWIDSQIIDLRKDLKLLYNLETGRWHELEDKDFADWKRVFDSIKHENTLLNQRITWLFSSQAFLFTAYTLVLIQFYSNDSTESIKNLYIVFLSIIALFGVLISTYIWRSGIGAINQLKELENWWHFYRHGERINSDLPEKDWVKLVLEREFKTRTFSLPLRAKNKYFVDRLINTEGIPLLLIIIWLLLIIGTVFITLSNILNIINTNWMPILIGICIASILLLLIINIRLKRKLERSSKLKNRRK